MQNNFIKLILDFDDVLKNKYPQIKPHIFWWETLDDFLKKIETFGGDRGKMLDQVEYYIENPFRKVKKIPNLQNIFNSLNKNFGFNDHCINQLSGIFYNSIQQNFNEKFSYIIISYLVNSIYSVFLQHKYVHLLRRYCIALFNQLFTLGCYYDLRKSVNQKYSFGIIILSNQCDTIENELTNPNTSIIPMVRFPKDWTHSYDDGGYIIHKTNLFNYKSLQESKIILSKEYLDGINILQKFSFTLNIKTLINIFNNDLVEIEDLLFEKNHLNHILLNDYYNIRIEMNASIPIPKSTKFSKMTNEEMSNYFVRSNNKHKNLLFAAKQTNTKNLIESLKAIINISIIMGRLEIHSLYLPIKLDSRGRMYNTGILNPVNTKLLRYLMEFNQKLPVDTSEMTMLMRKYYTLSQLKKVTSLQEIHKLNLPDSYDRNVRSLVTLEAERDSWTVQFDAVASMLQIIGMLTRDEKLLLDTNVYLSTDQTLQDPYNNIISILEKSTNFDELNNIQKVLFKICIERPIVKGILMRYVYGGGIKSISLFLKESYPGMLKVDCEWIQSQIILCFERCYPSVKLLRLFFKNYSKTLFKLGKYQLSYRVGDNLFKNTYFESTRKKLEKIPVRNIDNKISKINISYKGVEYSKINKTKYTTSLLPNYIHSLDGMIAYNVKMKMFKKSGIESFSIHDCFLIRCDHVHTLITTYNIELFNLSKINLLEVFPVEGDMLKNKILVKYASKIRKIYETKLDEGRIRSAIFTLIPQ